MEAAAHPASAVAAPECDKNCLRFMIRLIDQVHEWVGMSQNHDGILQRNGHRNPIGCQSTAAFDR